MTPKLIPTPENWRELHAHEYATIFPLVPTDALQATFPTMWETGYDDAWPIVLFEGKILDGRNRLRGALQSRCTPSFKEFTGTKGEALQWAIRANLHRRQLNDSQRAMVAAKILPMFKEITKEKQREAGGDKKSAAAKSLQEISPEAIEDPKPPAMQARDLAAAALNIKAGETVTRAATLMNVAPDLAEKVESGEMGVWEADAERKRREGKLPPKKARVGRSSPSPSSEGETSAAGTEPPSDGRAPGEKRSILAGIPITAERPYAYLCQTMDPTPEDRKLLADRNRTLILDGSPSNSAARTARHWVEDSYTDFILCLGIHATEKTVQDVIQHYTQLLQRLTENRPQ